MALSRGTLSELVLEILAQQSADSKKLFGEDFNYQYQNSSNFNFLHLEFLKISANCFFIFSICDTVDLLKKLL